MNKGIAVLGLAALATLGACGRGDSAGDTTTVPAVDTGMGNMPMGTTTGMTTGMTTKTDTTKTP